MKYIALLRGINVGGNNKVSMVALKTCFENLGFNHVQTYINSGNVLFDAKQSSNAALTARCEDAITETFGFNVVCSVLTADELLDAVAHAPTWWGKQDDDKHNALFVIPPATPSAIAREVGDAKPEYEKIATHGQVIFWTAPLKTFSRTRYSKIVGTKLYKKVTIRNSNTTLKLAELIKGTK